MQSANNPLNHISGHILLVSHNHGESGAVAQMACRLGCQVTRATGGQQAVDMLMEGDGSNIDLILAELSMPEIDGMKLVQTLRRTNISTPIIIQTPSNSIEIAVSALRAGAQDYIVKPVTIDRLAISIRNCVKTVDADSVIGRLEKKEAGNFGFDDIITVSPEMDRVLRIGRRAAASQIPVLLEGETGVGKELVARAIQGAGRRQRKAFVTVNCGAIPEHLVESTLFGHEKGAFTGANEKRIGKFREAHNGTLFLDEVGELPMDIQVKLLRAIQENEIDPVGASISVKADFRLISATNLRLLDMVKQGRFREDLYYRLNVYPIWIPPLRERKGDISILLHHFLARFAAEENKRQITGITRPAIDMLTCYHWPGNIRQLQNMVFRAVVLCDGDRLDIDDFPQIAGKLPRAIGVSLPQAQSATTNDERSLKREEGIDAPAEYSPGISSPFCARRPALPLGDVSPANGKADLPRFPEQMRVVGHPPGPEYSDMICGSDIPVGNDMAVGNDKAGKAPPAPETLRLLDDAGNMRHLEAVEADVIRAAIHHYEGQMSEVARRLGIGRSTLYRKIRSYGLDRGLPGAN